jgi:hypothetical protein
MTYGQFAQRMSENDVSCSGTDNSLKLLAWLTETFIATFGITHPSPEQQRVANLIIGGLLLVVLITVFGVIGFLIFALSHR